MPSLSFACCGSHLLRSIDTQKRHFKASVARTAASVRERRPSRQLPALAMTGAGGKRKVWMDCDVGVDDAQARAQCCCRCATCRRLSQAAVCRHLPTCRNRCLLLLLSQELCATWPGSTSCQLMPLLFLVADNSTPPPCFPPIPPVRHPHHLHSCRPPHRHCRA